MRLVNAESGIALSLEEGNVSMLIIEEKLMRRQFVEELYKQCQGEMGNFILSDKNQILKMNKTTDFILSPFTIDYNNKRLMTKLYQEIQDNGNENYFCEKEQINSQIISLFDKLVLNVPYNIVTALDFTFIDLCKMYDVRLDYSEDSFIEKLLDYFRVMK